MRERSVDLLIIGAGPTGLAAAERVRDEGWEVALVDRESEAGGIPRHCAHEGFGLRDLHRAYDGPHYAQVWTRRAQHAGAELQAGTTVTDWAGPTTVITTSRDGRTLWQARSVLLATGCRERPRPARLVPGDRPAGVFTSGSLQQLTYLHHQQPGRRAVVIGAEHITFSAVHTLYSYGAQVAAVITESPVLQTFHVLQLATAGLHRVPVLTRHELSAIHGRGRVTGVEITDLATGTRRDLECDTVIFTGDWIPDHELARRAGLSIDPATRGPVVDTGLHTSTPAVFAAGNLIHPAEPADIAACGGRHAGHSIATWLAGAVSDADALPIEVNPPLAWITPQLVRPGTPPPRGRFVLRASQLVGAGELRVKQAGRELYRHRKHRLIPNRSITLPARWLEAVNPAAGPVEISYRGVRAKTAESPAAV